MSSTNRYSEYDGFASMYDEQGTDHHDIVVAQLQNLLLQHLPKGAHILDLCCGTGQIAQRLLKKGYRVTGIDGSEAMLHYARENAPGAEFILDDARFFKLPPTFYAVISTDIGLNLVITLEELKDVFHNVYAALLKNGFFVFDLSLEEEFFSSDSTITKSTTDVKDNHVWISRNSYDVENKIARDHTIRFQLINKNWHRSDMTFIWKFYSAVDVQSALEKVGFTEVKIYDVKRDFGNEIKRDFGIDITDRIGNKACFVCRKAD